MLIPEPAMKSIIRQWLAEIDDLRAISYFLRQVPVPNIHFLQYHHFFLIIVIVEGCEPQHSDGTTESGMWYVVKERVPKTNTFPRYIYVDLNHVTMPMM